jgi:hypothetical protein
VRAVEADHHTGLMGRRRQPRDIEQLSRAVEHRRQQRQRDLVGHRGDHVLLGDGAAVTARDEHEIAVGIAAAVPDQALQRVDVGGEVE